MEDNLKILLCEDDENLGMLFVNTCRQRATQPTYAPTAMLATRLL